jgi:hypothetical protein
MLARTERVAPGCAVANFCLPHTDFSNQSFGILKYSGQAESASTPKYTAAKDYADGKRKLIPLVGELSAGAGSALNTVVGTLKRRTPDSSVSVATTPSGALAFVDSTAQVLQLKVANASLFAAAGSISWTVTETDARDPAGSLDTGGTLNIIGGTIFDAATLGSGFVLSGGLTATRSSGSGDSNARATVARTSGYCEFVIGALGSTNDMVGITHAEQSSADWLGDTTASAGYKPNGELWYNGSLRATYGAYTASDVIGMCLKGGKLYFSKNGTWQGGADPSAGTGGWDVSATVTNAIPAVSSTTTGTQVTGRFSSGHAFTIPSGVTAWT